MFFLLPYGNDRQNSQFPAVTYSLIVGNVVVYLCLLPLGADAIISQFGLSPSHPSAMYILTSMFVHVSFLHLTWNMLFLWLFGQNVEDVLGRVKYLLLYLASGFIAAILNSFIATRFMPNAANIPVIGASGAIAGIVGFFAIRFYKTGIKVFWWVIVRCGTFTIPAMYGLGIWFLQQFAGGVLSVVNPLLTAHGWFMRIAQSLLPEGIAYWSHIGGMAFGMFIAYVFNMHIEGTKEYLMKDAKLRLEEGTTWQAAENLSAILACDPKNSDVHASLARTYALQQDADLAIVHYQRCIELFLSNGEPDKAITAFIELRSFYRNAQIGLELEFQLARRMEDIGRCEPALQLFKEIAYTYPGTPEAEVALMKAGNLYLDKMDKPNDAVVYFEKFLKEYPASSWRTMVLRSLIGARGKQL